MLIVSLAVGYRPALEVRNDPSIQDNEFILYPTDLLCGNMHGSPFAYYGFQAGRGQHLIRSATREIPVQPSIEQEEMRNHLLRLRGRRGVIVGWQLDSLFTALQLSVGEYSTIDLAFIPIIRSYVRQLAQAAGYEEELIARMFPLDVRYNIGVRYLAVLLCSDQHLWSCIRIRNVIPHMRSS